MCVRVRCTALHLEKVLMSDVFAANELPNDSLQVLGRVSVPYPRRRALTQHAISVSSEKHMQLEVNFNYSDLKAVDGRWILITLD